MKKQVVFSIALAILLVVSIGSADLWQKTFTTSPNSAFEPVEDVSGTSGKFYSQVDCDFSEEVSVWHTVGDQQDYYIDINETYPDGDGYDEDESVTLSSGIAEDCTITYEIDSENLINGTVSYKVEFK